MKYTPITQIFNIYFFSNTTAVIRTPNPEGIVPIYSHEHKRRYSSKLCTDAMGLQRCYVASVTVFQCSRSEVALHLGSLQWRLPRRLSPLLHCFVSKNMLMILCFYTAKHTITKILSLVPNIYSLKLTIKVKYLKAQNY